MMEWPIEFSGDSVCSLDCTSHLFFFLTRQRFTTLLQKSVLGFFKNTAAPNISVWESSNTVFLCVLSKRRRSCCAVGRCGLFRAPPVDQLAHRGHKEDQGDGGKVTGVDEELRRDKSFEQHSQPPIFCLERWREGSVPAWVEMSRPRPDVSTTTTVSSVCSSRAAKVLTPNTRA